jgi:hypothetical protein
MLSNEVNEIEVLLSNHSSERKQLESLDLSNLLIIKNPNNEVAFGNINPNIGYSPDVKIPIDILNTSESEKNIIHQRYGTFTLPPNRFSDITPSVYMQMKSEILFIKYTVLILSIIILMLDVKNIKSRIAQQEDIISEVMIIFY